MLVYRKAGASLPRSAERTCLGLSLQLSGPASLLNQAVDAGPWSEEQPDEGQGNKYDDEFQQPVFLQRRQLFFGFFSQHK